MTDEQRRQIYEEERVRREARKQLRAPIWRRVGFVVAILIVIVVGLTISGIVALDRASTVGSIHMLVPPLIASTPAAVDRLVDNANGNDSYANAMLEKLGLVSEVSPNARVRVISGDHSKCHVEVVKASDPSVIGKHNWVSTGKQGWVSTAWLQ